MLGSDSIVQTGRIDKQLVFLTAAEEWVFNLTRLSLHHFLELPLVVHGILSSQGTIIGRLSAHVIYTGGGAHVIISLVLAHLGMILRLSDELLSRFMILCGPGLCFEPFVNV